MAELQVQRKKQARAEEPRVKVRFAKIRKLVDIGCGDFLEPNDIVAVLPNDDTSGSGWLNWNIRTATKSWSELAVKEDLAVFV